MKIEGNNQQRTSARARENERSRDSILKGGGEEAGSSNAQVFFACEAHSHLFGNAAWLGGFVYRRSKLLARGLGSFYSRHSNMSSARLSHGGCFPGLLGRWWKASEHVWIHYRLESACLSLQPTPTPIASYNSNRHGIKDAFPSTQFI